MSRTHKTKPYNVQMYQGHAPVKDIHDHSKGPCDLPPFDAKNVGIGTRCYWTWEYDGKNHFCGCNLCTGHRERVRANKISRNKTKRQLKNWKKNPDLYDEEVEPNVREFW